MPGGQAASTVIACQTWGLRTRYVGKIGDDDAGRLHRSEFARAGVDARLIEVPDAASPQSLILVDGGGERTVLCRRDERLLLQPDDLDREWIVHARALHVDGYETAAATMAARWAREAGIPVIADLDETYAGVEDLIENIDYLIVSRDFPARLTGERNLEQALRRFASATAAGSPPRRLARMACWRGTASRFHLPPAYRVPVVDTTGAGDIFHAGFIYALLQGWELEQSARFCLRGGGIELHCVRGARRNPPRRSSKTH